MNKITTIIGLSFAIFFLVGLATTLTRSMMITFWDVLPVYILMGIAIFMMVYEAFFDKSSKNFEELSLFLRCNQLIAFCLANKNIHTT